MTKIKEIRFRTLCTLMFTAVFGLACQEYKAPPLNTPIPIKLSLNHEDLDVLQFLKTMSKRPDGAEVFRRILMKQALLKSITSRAAEAPSINISEWQSRLPKGDADDAELYGLASYIVHLESLTTKALEKRFKQLFPRSYRLIGRQVQLSPRQVWTEDHYQRNIGALRSRARLKLIKIRHQVIEGAEFGELAHQVSHHSSSQKKNGEVSLDLLKRESFSSQIIRVASSLRVGEISPVLQDSNGTYLLINEGQKRSFTLEAEGVFFPNSVLNSAKLQSTEFWQLLEKLCEQSNQCDLKQILPADPVGKVWREAWSRVSPKGRLSDQKRKKRNRRKHRLNQRSKGDTRHLSGRENSWSTIPPSLFEINQAQYHPRVSKQIFESLQLSSRSFFFERAPLFKALPFVFNTKGAWLIRLKARTIFPKINQGQLRLIALDLSKKGLQQHWGTWGLDSIGRQLKLAADHQRLDEALSTLGLSAHPIKISSLSADLIKSLLEADLDTGTKVFYSPHQTSKANEQGHHWTLIELIRKEPVKFSEVKKEVIADFERERLNISTLRKSLAQFWSSLKVSWQLHDEVFTWDSASSRGFLRKVDLNLQD